MFHIISFGLLPGTREDIPDEEQETTCYSWFNTADYRGMGMFILSLQQLATIPIAKDSVL